jgi:hypothetical protein
MKHKAQSLTAVRLRHALADRTTWLAAIVIPAVVALILLATVRIPASIRHEVAAIIAVTITAGDHGNRPIYSAATADGREFSFSAASRLALAEPGDRVCLRIQTDRFTGRVTADAALATQCRTGS